MVVDRGPRIPYRILFINPSDDTTKYMKVICDIKSTLKFFTNAGYNSVSNKNIAIVNKGDNVAFTLVSTAEVG